MPDNKRQHFVPQFYLRNFADDPERRSIRLFVLRRGLMMPQASIKGQCHRNFYYGADGRLEAAMGELEGEAAKIFRAIIDNHQAPRPMIQDHRTLVDFVASLLGRTEAAESELNQTVDAFGRQILARARPDLAEDLDKVTIGWSNAVIVALSHALAMSPVLWDLHFRVLTAAKEMTFITSDNPVVLFNQTFDPLHETMTRGLASAGLQIYFPVSPRHAILFYDPNWYRPGRGRDGFVPVYPIDIKQLNALQIGNAREHLYWSGAGMDGEVARLHALHAASRPQRAAEVRAERMDRPDGHRGELLTLIKPRPNLVTKLDVLNNRTVPQGPVSSVRAPEWTNIVRLFVYEVEQGRRDAASIFEFVSAHPLANVALSRFIPDRR
ncbi:MAG: DUF4238 domain-containing protein [Alphaproteobacteria bacterium]|nr:DUF4238 domain-containing protein [Alphaproteobacteria bacterium]